MPEMPEWVNVWAWLRFVHEPPVHDPLPQQDFHPDAMTLERYNELHAEWQSVGSPTLTAEQAVAVMAGALDEDPGF